MIEKTYLNGSVSLATWVADFLLSGVSGRNLGDTEIWIPTTGAGRRIRRALAERGVLSPHFTQPMRALLPDGKRIAERFEREGAWALAFEKMDIRFLEPLFSVAKLDSVPARLKSGAVLCDVCDLLAEAGRSPVDSQLPEICGYDAARWEALGRVYQCYLSVLKALELVDPNEARFAEVMNPSRAKPLRRLVIACIPDLPLVAQRYAEALEKKGVKVEVLVWSPGELAGGFDDWGRPLSAEWAKCRLSIASDQIAVARSPEHEAKQAFDFALAADTPGDYAVVLADPDLGSAFRGEVESRGGKAFLPDGGRLDLSEAGIMALEWPRFQLTGDLRVLRRLLELPHFSRVVRGGSELKPDDALAVCDYLIGEVVLSDFTQAEAFANVPFDSKKEKSKRRPQVAGFVAMVKASMPLSVPDLLAKAWRQGGEGLETARKVVKLHQTISKSPLYSSGIAGVDHALARAMKSEAVFDTSLPGEVELSGWLEAPWLESGRLALCGCAEGFLPSSVNGHPFLPDSKRKALGLADNDSRFARDAYLLQCLLRVRPADSFRCSFSRFDAEGSPAMPSRLFLRCSEDELPGRVLGLFGKLPSGGSRARRENQWKWKLPGGKAKEVFKMSPTDFSEYLACPFRFYLKKVLWLDKLTADAREMDAKRFGLLVHEALEKFGKETPERRRCRDDRDFGSRASGGLGLKSVWPHAIACSASSD
jgi:ATP-dependent helicase/nuclease subunit B